MFTTQGCTFSGWFCRAVRAQVGQHDRPSRDRRRSTPLPPNSAETPSPAASERRCPVTAVTLQWYGGPWSHLYDIYLDTNPNPTTLIASNLELGPSESATEMQSHFVSAPLNGHD